MKREELIQRLESVENQTRRQAIFMGIVSREVRARDADTPTIVGGFAVELLTRGHYTSHDIDVLAHKEILDEVLTEMGFEKEGRHYIFPDLELYIEWQGSEIDKSTDSPEKCLDLDLEESGLVLRLIGFEDLVVDRLCAHKYWDDSDSLLWAAKILEQAKENAALDLDYLEKKAEKEDVSDALAQAMHLIEQEQEQENVNMGPN